MAFLIPLIGGVAATIISANCDSDNRAEAARTERCVREERERVEREKRLAIERVERQRQEAMNQMCINRNAVLCKDLDAQRERQYQRFCTTAKTIFANRDMRIADITKNHESFVWRQKEMIAYKKMDLAHKLDQKIEMNNIVENNMDRLIAERKARLEKKRIDMMNAQKIEEMKKKFWKALCEILANYKSNGKNANDMMAYLTPEILKMLEPEQLDMINKFFDAVVNEDQKEKEEEIRQILLQSALMLRAILDKYGLTPTNGWNAAVLHINAQKVMEMGHNDLFFVLSNGGEMFTKVLVDADQLNVAEFIMALCNYSTMTELPQLIVPNIVLRFNKSSNVPIPNMTDVCNAFLCEKHNEKYVANNSAVPSVKCVVEITSNGQHPPKMENFQLTIVGREPAGAGVVGSFEVQNIIVPVALAFCLFLFFRFVTFLIHNFVQLFGI